MTVLHTPLSKVACLCPQTLSTLLQTFVVKDENVVLAYEDQSSPKQHVAKAIEALKGSGGSGGAGGGSQPYQPGELSDKQNEAFTAAEQL